MVDMTGQRYARVVALEYLGSSDWAFKCDCGTIFITKGHHVRTGNTQSCGCLNIDSLRARKKWNPEPRTCLICQLMFVPKQTARKGIYCSVQCRQTGIARATAKVRGEVLRDRGDGISYRKRGGRHEHRLVAEHTAGRKLLEGEVVHHLNGDHRDNRPENLEILSSQAEHNRRHALERRK